MIAGLTAGARLAGVCVRLIRLSRRFRARLLVGDGRDQLAVARLAAYPTRLRLLLRGLGAVLLVCDLPDCGLGAVGIIREDVLLSSAPQAQSQDGRQGYQGTGRRATEFDPLGGNRRLFGDRIGSGPLVLFSVYKLSLTDLLL